MQYCNHESENIYLLLTFFIFISSPIQCLEKPHKPQYGGGIIKNPELNHGLKGWSAFENAKIEQRESGGNKFLVAHSRSQPYDSISQKVHLKKNKLYTLSGNFTLFATLLIKLK